MMYNNNGTIWLSKFRKCFGGAISATCGMWLAVFTDGWLEPCSEKNGDKFLKWCKVLAITFNLMIYCIVLIYLVKILVFNLNVSLAHQLLISCSTNTLFMFHFNFISMIIKFLIMSVCTCAVNHTCNMCSVLALSLI